MSIGAFSAYVIKEEDNYYINYLIKTLYMLNQVQNQQNIALVMYIQEHLLNYLL